MSRPFVAPVVWLAVGVWCGAWLGETRFASQAWPEAGAEGVRVAGSWPVVAAVLLIVVAGAWAWSRGRSAAAWLAVLGLMSGGACVSGYTSSWVSAVEACSALHAGEVVGVLVEDARDSRWGATAAVRTAEAGLGDFEITVALDDCLAREGSLVRLEGVTEPVSLEDQERARSALRRGVVGRVNPWRVEDAGWRIGPIGALQRWRAGVAARMESLPEPGGALLAGVLLADRRRLRGTDVEQDFRVAGLSHLLAVSGLHLGIMSAAVGWLLRRAGTTRTVQAAGVLVAATGFAAFTGLQPSVVRALVMVCVAWGGALAGRRGSALAALAVTICVMVAVRPVAVFDVSLQLSVSAVGGLILFGDLAARWLDRAGVGRVVGRSLGATAVAQVATFPVSASTFGMFSLVAPLSNIVAVPLTGVALGLGFGGTFLGRIPLIGEGAVWAAAWLMGVCARIAEIAASVPHAAIPVGAPGLWVVALWVAGVGAWSMWPRPPSAGVARVTVAVAVLLALAAARWPWPGADRLVVMDVGQADAILLADSGSTMLVDCGGHPGDVLAALGRQGIRTIDVLVLTHAHDDHTGGLSGLVGTTVVGWVGVPVVDEQDAVDWAGSGCRRLTPRGRVPVRRLRRGDTWAVGDARVEVLWPDGPARGRETNDTSVILRVTTEQWSAVLGGDAEEGVWGALSRDAGLTDVDVLKPAHHGSSNGVETDSLAAMTPEIALVSCGTGNSFGHPAPEALEMLAGAGARVFRTDLSGDLEVRGSPNGTGIVVRTSR